MGNIKIQDLRIGNYISDEGNYATIELINGEEEEVFYKGRKTYLSSHIDYILPIEINYESLIKLGFKINFENSFNVSFIFNDLEYHIPKHNLNKGFAFYKRLSFEINYVHELQNLYFVLTGSELNVL